MRANHFNVPNISVWIPQELILCVSFPWHQPEQPDGSYKLERKGYEYPVKTQVLKLDNPRPTGKKDKQFFVNICHSSYAGLSVDLIDTYLQVAENKYGSDEKLMKKIKDQALMVV